MVVVVAYVVVVFSFLCSIDEDPSFSLSPSSFARGGTDGAGELWRSIGRLGRVLVGRRGASRSRVRACAYRGHGQGRVVSTHAVIPVPPRATWDVVA